MSTTTWHVAITLSCSTGGVAAEAQLDDGARQVVGVGHAPGGRLAEPGGRDYALAASRSLEALSDALGYQLDMSNLAAADQA